MNGPPPNPIPDGWFRIAFCEDLKPGLVEPLRYFGRDLVLFVGESGTPVVLDAYCPHLGAHLAHGGRVEGETIRCPFHAWRFAADGRCVEIPYAKRIPPRAAVRTWPTCIRNGMVFVWHHAQGAEPSWEVPEADEVGDSDWTPWVHRSWQIETHIQEIAENTSDPAHFTSVHGFPAIPDPKVSFAAHAYRSYTEFTAQRADGSEVETILDVQWSGMGIGITRTRGVLDLLFIGTHTPIEADIVDSRFSFSVCSARGLDPEHGAGRAFIDESVRQMEQDIPIWNNKRFHEKPTLCDGDGPIPEFRSWARQFYSASDGMS